MRYLHLLTLVLTGGPVNAQTPDAELEKARADVAVAVAIANLKDKPAPSTTPPKQTDAERYADFVRAVERGGGGAQVMIVGSRPRLDEYVIQEFFPSGFMGLADGVYDCFGQNGKAMMRKREEPADAHPFRPFQPGLSPTIPTTPAPSVVVPSSSSAGVVPYRAAIPTPARRVILGGTRIGSDGCASPFG